MEGVYTVKVEEGRMPSSRPVHRSIYGRDWFLSGSSRDGLSMAWQFFRACITAVGEVWSMVGTVGVPVPSAVEVRLESVLDMGYDALSSSAPRGEICLRGTTLFSGYHKCPDLTDEVIVEGLLHTGHIGEWQPDGALKIIDRKKNIFKLSQGEYVTVESVENIFVRCPHVTSVWVYGNSFEFHRSTNYHWMAPSV